MKPLEATEGAPTIRLGLHSKHKAINMLRDKAPGTFVVRDSNSFPGAFGLALKVATPPPGVAPGNQHIDPLIGIVFA
ncbi:hypothetical protein ANCCEY_08240 [Ancylostoma ceylanicum]|uniref:SH2 domain-containing protein n=1 Tax=Ancylostoma ceylanicum TaxID=53326 RepID=A0A0D6LYJ0_9BILA|nr:hypothetical protein ANCCEY_08240 [Ancylostoma ceylanicum]